MSCVLLNPVWSDRLIRYASPSCPFIPTGKQQSSVQHIPFEWTSNQAVTFGWWTNSWHHVGRFLNLIVFFVSPKWLKKSTEIRDYCRTFLCCWRCWRGGRKSGFCTFLLVGEKNKSRYIAPFFLWLFFPRYMWLLVRVRCSRMGRGMGMAFMWGTQHYAKVQCEIFHFMKSGTRTNTSGSLHYL